MIFVKLQDVSKLTKELFRNDQTSYDHIKNMGLKEIVSKFHRYLFFRIQHFPKID